MSPVEDFAELGVRYFELADLIVRQRDFMARKFARFAALATCAVSLTVPLMGSAQAPPVSERTDYSVGDSRAIAWRRCAS